MTFFPTKSNATRHVQRFQNMKHFDLKHKFQLFPSLVSLGWLSISRFKYETHAYKGNRATAETGTQYGGAANNVIRDRAISVSVKLVCRWRCGEAVGE